MTTRRDLLKSGAALGAITVLPFGANAMGHTNAFDTENGTVNVFPISHASFVMETPAGTIYVDPVGAAEDYANYPDPDLILITHEHGDHYSAELLAMIAGAATQMVCNPAVYDMMPAELQSKTQQIANGDNTDAMGIQIDAIPAYNITEGREKFHPKGRDNGYVLTIDGLRVYVSGDTEGVDEMRALTDIDVAFVCMNLPFTMAAEQAADAVAEFSPTFVYPYHYRGRDNGTQDPKAFADLLAQTDAETEVRFGPWYPDGLG